ncbi:MAG: hypothetical protein JWN67_2937 [Actinomycetia bacterium]|nr:hypothetical protein [Actinomycetes bacterium]
MAELAELTARWVEGDLVVPEVNGGTPDPETLEIASHIAAINRLGFLTEFSQPGEEVGGYLQRASVSGYCSEGTCNAILAALVPTDLVILAVPAMLDSYVQIPISLDDGVECTWAGGNSDPADSEFGEAPGALAEVRDSWHVDVIDPVWGRNDVLWPALQDALAAPKVRRITNNGQFEDDEPPPGAEIV